MHILAKLCVVLLVTTVYSQQKVSYSENKVHHDGRTVLLGGLFPISWNEDNECRGLRTTAVEALEAMVFIIRTINQNRTLLPQVNLTFDIRDTCSIPNKALEKTLSFVQGPGSTCMEQNTDTMLAVSGVVGAGLFSHVSEAVASLLRLFQVTQISYGSSAAVLSDRVRFDYFFRTLPSDEFLARAMGDVVNYFGWTYIITLHSDDTFGRRGLEIMIEKIRLNSTRQCVAIQIAMPLVATDEDWDAIVAQMSQPHVRNASVALLYGYRRQASGIMKAITKLLKTQPDSPLRSMTWVGCEALLVHEEYPDLIHGMINLQYKVNMSYDFQRHFTSMRPDSQPNNPHFQSYWETKFNCDMQGQNGLPRCDNFDLTDYTQESEISSIIDAVYAFAHAIHGLIEEHCPQTQELCSNITVRHPAGMAVNGTMIRDYLLQNLSFPGLSAEKVQFDTAGNDLSSYVVLNLQLQPDGTYQYRTIGTWDPVNLLDFTSDPEWNEGNEVPVSVCSLPCENGWYPEYLRDQDCCWTCQECLGDNTISTGQECSECETGFSPNEEKSECIQNPIYYLTWSNPWGVVITLATCLGLVATGAVCVVFAVFYKHAIVKASSRELSFILLTGLMLCYIQPFFFVAKPSVATCTLRRFFVGFSFAVCFSALLVKTNRLHRIFNRSPDQLKTTPRFISPLSQVVISLILISVQAVIGVLWLAIEQPSTDYTYSSKVTELKCGESSDIGLIITLGYSLLLLILSTYFAFLARKIPENFNEARFINVTLYTIIIIWLAFIPTYFATAKLGSVYQTSSLVIAIILSASTTLCCLFMPKVFLLTRKVVKEKREISTSTPNTTTVNVTSKSARA